MTIQGITIQIIEKTESGRDPANRPVYTEIATDVDDVLVGEPSSEEIADEINLSGKRVAYILAIPKGDAHIWENTKVILPEPFAGTYRTIGYPTAGIEANIPLRWNKKVRVERVG